MITVVLVAIGGALGAALRADVTKRLSHLDWPVATMALNTAASFLLGVFIDQSVVITAGLLGALSTWSTLAYELVTLGRQRSLGHAAAAASVSLVAGVGAAWLGLQLG